MNIPVFKPSLCKDEKKAAVEALELGWLGPGSYVKEFEEAIAQLIKVDPGCVVAVNTGTSAVHIALKLCGVGCDDEVITPSFNNIADFQSIRALHANPVFCDIKESNLTIDPHKIEELITPKTKAIIALDYGSAICNFEEIKKIADKYSIPLLYDAAHSFGSKKSCGKMVGNDADFCTFSFDPVKNITCIDGGAVVFKDPNLAEKARYMRLLGQKQNQDKLYTNTRSWTYDVDDIGYRYHLANLHGAIGLKQIEKIEDMKRKRQNIFSFYQESLTEIDHIILPEPIHNGIFPFMFVIRILHNKRQKFIEFLREHGVDTGIHWQPGHKFSCFQHCKKGDLSVTEEIGNQIVTLPMYPDLTRDEMEKVVSVIQEAFRKI